MKKENGEKYEFMNWRSLSISLFRNLFLEEINKIKELNFREEWWKNKYR